MILPKRYQRWKKHVTAKQSGLLRTANLPLPMGRAGRLADADMTLAEEALLTGDTQQAIKMARRTLSYENLRDELQNRANDILFRYGAAAK
jgi:hypothetical protein